MSTLTEEIVSEGRLVANHLFQQIVVPQTTMKKASIAVEVCYRSAIHIIATCYYNDVTKSMRKSGPVTREKFIEEIISNLDNELKFMEENPEGFEAINPKNETLT